MLLREITEANFQEHIQERLSLVTFSSPWCASCKKIASSLEALSGELNTHVMFGTCDISTQPAIAANLQVFSVPAVIIFQNGHEITRFQGAVSDASILRALNELL
jgi:thioredoxin-like negative regulator of GroEL